MRCLDNVVGWRMYVFLLCEHIDVAGYEAM